ncbi:MAG: cbb3-type cytochrome c oxidase subunit I [Acidimicrobiia bacterium]|nr:cbb3-type cytochrome c oxidase subunit I [Acidimicrobiia bacterium]MDX2465722.1 cbb3-type cytochrome c oxidase subunit I [Acidimicrobiia bacterium]
MTADVAHENQTELATPAASSQSVARHHLAASLGFLIVGVLMLAVASVQYAAPELLSGSGALSYGRLRPAAIHFLLYGWLTLGLIGAFYYAVPRLVGVKLTDPMIARIGFVLMSVGYAVGGLAILFGQTEGARYLEAPPVADLIVLLGMVAMSHSIARTISRRTSRDRSPAEWFILAAVLWLVGLHVIGNLNMLSLLATIFYSQPPVLHGINSAILAGFYKAGIIGLWAATASVGILYFLVPRLVGLTEFKATRMSVVGFWGLGIAWAFTGSAELTFTAIPDWLETIGVMFSLALLLPVATIIVDITTFLRGRTAGVSDKDRYSLNLVYLGLGLFAAVPVLNLMQALRASGGVVGYTDWVYGVEILAILGAFSSWLFAYVYHVAPAMVTADARRVQKWHGWLTLAGLAIAVFAMLLGGVVTGFTWAGGEAGGAVAVGDGFESTADAMWNFGFAIARIVGLVIFALGQALLFAYATVAWFLEPDRDSVLTADPQLDAGGQEVNDELALNPGSEPTWRRVGSIALAAGIGVFTLVVFLPALEAESATPSILADESRLYVDDSDSAAGRDIYISEGCVYCHTQSVRPIVTDLGLGAVSVSGDYAHEEPVLLGVARMGPDLMHVADRGGTTVDHLKDPREERPWSTMPSYDYLSAADLEVLVAYVNGLK